MAALVLLTPVVLLLCWQLYIPKVLAKSPSVVYSVQKGTGNDTIANDLANQGIIKSAAFFKWYVVLSGNSAKLQAGMYSLSPSMSIASIVKKLVTGGFIKDNITVLEGWDARDIAKYLESKKVYSKKEFLAAIDHDFSREFDILKDKPKDASLEGYLFPDTYQVSLGEMPEDVLKNMVANLERKLTPELRVEITSQHKSVFEVITMASIIEKEVKKTDDKKVVAGILWKRLANNMPLQVDATINYITDKNDPSVSIKDTRIDSRYNTYKYVGLPAGPISNPGMDSILAAMYPKESPYWYYLSADRTGKTIFSKTLEDHQLAMAKYLR